MEKQQTSQGISSNALKGMAALFMLIDHIAVVLGGVAIRQNLFGSAQVVQQVSLAMRTVGRLAFPLFIFTFVEGFFHTKSRTRYLVRLLIFAVLSEVPFDIALRIWKLDLNRGVWIDPTHQNVLFTFAISFVLLWALETIRPTKELISALARPATQEAQSEQTTLAPPVTQETQSEQTAPVQSVSETPVLERPASEKGVSENNTSELLGRLVGCLACTALAFLGARALRCDYSWYGVCAVLLTYLMYLFGLEKLSLLAVFIPLYRCWSLERFIILDFPLLALYDGTRGSRECKWFFYLFYPSHLLVLALLKLLLLFYI